MLIELCGNTWLEEKDVDDFWSKIPKSRNAEGKDTETVGKKALREFVIERTFEKL